MSTKKEVIGQLAADLNRSFDLLVEKMRPHYAVRASVDLSDGGTLSWKVWEVREKGKTAEWALVYQSRDDLHMGNKGSLIQNAPLAVRCDAAVKLSELFERLEDALSSIERSLRASSATLTAFIEHMNLLDGLGSEVD